MAEQSGSAETMERPSHAVKSKTALTLRGLACWIIEIVTSKRTFENAFHDVGRLMDSLIRYSVCAPWSSADAVRKKKDGRVISVPKASKRSARWS